MNYIVKDKPIIVQKIVSQQKDALGKAVKYYSVLCALNNIRLSPMEMNMLSFAGVKGSLWSGGSMKQFCELFNSTPSSAGNLIYKLRKKGLLIRINTRIRVIPALSLDFKRDLLLNIHITDE